MTYSLTRPMPYGYLPAYYTQGMGGFAGLGAAQASTACEVWVQTHYNVAEYERIRTQELPQLLAEAPKPSYLPNPPVGQPLSWSAFGYPGARPVGYQEGDPIRDVIVRRSGASGFGLLAGLGATNISGGASARRGSEAAVLAGAQKRAYDSYLSAVLHWINRVIGAFNRMGLALNLPTYWLLPTSNARVSSRFGDLMLLDQQEPAPVLVNSFGRLVGDEPPFRNCQFPFTLSWRSVPVALLSSTRKLKSSTWYGVSREGLVPFWKKFIYDNQPQQIPGRCAGYPAGASDTYGIAIPPAAVAVREGASWLAAESSTASQRLFAGPVYTVWLAEQYLRTIASRSAFDVLANAYESYADVLNAWTDAPASKLGSLKDQVKQAANGLKMASIAFKSSGQAATTMGAATGAFPVTIIGAVVSALGFIAGIMEGAVGTLSGCSSDESKNAPQRIFLNGRLGFCGPPPPLLTNPPEGCTPAEVLRKLREADEKDKSFWETIRPYVTHPATLAAIGLVVAYGVYRTVAPKTKNMRRRGRGYLHNAAEKIRKGDVVRHVPTGRVGRVERLSRGDEVWIIWQGSIARWGGQKVSVAELVVLPRKVMNPSGWRGPGNPPLLYPGTTRGVAGFDRVRSVKTGQLGTVDSVFSLDGYFRVRWDANRRVTQRVIPEEVEYVPRLRRNAVKTYRGTNYYSTEAEARQVANREVAPVFPSWRIVEYQRGFAIQYFKSGPYYPAPFEEGLDNVWNPVNQGDS